MNRPLTPQELHEAEERAYADARARLQDLGLWHDGADEDVRAYARAKIEAERATSESRSAAPGSRAAQVAGAAARQWTRQESILRRRIGLTTEAKPDAPAVALHEMFRVPERTEAETDEVMRKLRARIELHNARTAAEYSIGTRFEEKNTELRLEAEREHGWVEEAS